MLKLRELEGALKGKRGTTLRVRGSICTDPTSFGESTSFRFCNIRNRYSDTTQRGTDMSEKSPETPGAGEGVMGLTEVEPSPVEETPAEFKDDYFPSQPQSSRTSMLGLGNHGPAYYRKFVQISA